QPTAFVGYLDIALARRSGHNSRMDQQLDPSDFDIRVVPDVSNSELWNCPELLAFRCPEQWDKLSPMASPDVRWCSHCRRDVYWCSTADEFIYHGTLGHCVAIPATVSPGALCGGMLGVVSTERVQEVQLSNQRIREWWSKVLS